MDIPGQLTFGTLTALASNLKKGADIAIIDTTGELH